MTATVVVVIVAACHSIPCLLTVLPLTKHYYGSLITIGAVLLLGLRCCLPIPVGLLCLTLLLMGLCHCSQTLLVEAL